MGLRAPSMSEFNFIKFSNYMLITKYDQGAMMNNVSLTIGRPNEQTAKFLHTSLLDIKVHSAIWFITPEDIPSLFIEEEGIAKEVTILKCSGDIKAITLSLSDRADHIGLVVISDVLAEDLPSLLLLAAKYRHVKFAMSVDVTSLRRQQNLRNLLQSSPSHRPFKVDNGILSYTDPEGNTDFKPFVDANSNHELTIGMRAIVGESGLNIMSYDIVADSVLNAQTPTLLPSFESCNLDNREGIQKFFMLDRPLTMVDPKYGTPKTPEWNYAVKDFKEAVEAGMPYLLFDTTGKNSTHTLSHAGMMALAARGELYGEYGTIGLKGLFGEDIFKRVFEVRHDNLAIRISKVRIYVNQSNQLMYITGHVNMMGSAINVDLNVSEPKFRAVTDPTSEPGLITIRDLITWDLCPRTTTD